MRTIEEIMAAMNTLLAGAENRSLTSDEVAEYEALEAELASVQATNQVRARDDARRQPAAPGPAAPRATVREALPYNVVRRPGVTDAGRYRFATNGFGHDFSTDLYRMINMGGAGCNDETQRLNAFIAGWFAPTNDVDRTDTASLNPNEYRPDLWQPQMDYATPLWDMVDSGDTDGNSFDVPKFSSSSGMVGAATEGTEPSGGSYVATSQTITPTQVWGKVEITRQAARRGGRPELSGILWEQMLREYYEDREAAVATFLATLTAATDITLTGTPLTTPDNDDDQLTMSDLERAIADLQFVRGGNRFRAFAVHQDLFRVMARVKDDAGRPLYPMINPQNANGTSESLFSYITIAGTRAVGSWALTPAAGGTAAVNSWLFDPAKVRGWASSPERLDWNFGATVQTANIPQLSHVTMGIYGDVAFANLDIAGVRQVIFDPSV